LTSSSPTRGFRFLSSHLKRAVTNNLPCFYINFEGDIGELQLPSVTKAATWIRQTVQQQSQQAINDFSLFIPAGNKRYKFGVKSKNDFLKLWNCKWPGKMGQIKVEIERPRRLPDCCASVLRYIPTELSNEFIVREVNKTINSAVAFSKINPFGTGAVLKRH
jgi:hypothetical protein